jgi:two-component system chemotaxis response regulator CheY
MSLTILIVDDSETSRAVMAKTLRLAQIPIGQVLQADNGQSALDLLAGSWVDLVLADVNMPVMNGLEMIRRMAADDVLKTIPVVVVSTEGSQTRLEELQASGAVDFVRKPYSPETLSAVVKRALGVAV